LAPLDVNENDWTDIIMFCHSMLYEYKDTLANTDLARLLKKQITSTDKELIEIRQFDWELYTEISEKSFNIQPSGIFTNRIFNDFKIKKPKNIDQVVYKILL